MLDMIADLCRLYHYSVDHVLSMPMSRAAFLWGRGVSAERLQAFRIAAAINGQNLDKMMAEKEQRKREFRDGRPSEEGEAIIRRIMEGNTDE